MALDDRVHRLTENLEGTNRNLKSLDRMLDQYREVSRDHRHNVDRLREDVGRTHQQIRDERLRSPQYRDYGSDSEYEGASPVSRRRCKPRRSTVRFADDMNRELHHLHHAVRDLSSDHLNLETSFNREVERRDGNPVQESSETLTTSPDSATARTTEAKKSNLVSKRSSLKKQAKQAIESVQDICQPVTLVPDNRKFAPIKYERDFKWLYYSVVKEGYMCKMCEMFGTTADTNKPFARKGIKLGTHPSRKLHIHEQSKFHKFSVQRYSAAKSNINVMRQLTIQADEKKKASRLALKKIFNCLDFMIKQKWALTENLEKFVKFVAQLGVNDLKDYLSSEHITYLSSSSISQMVICISDYLERQLLDKLHTTEFSLLADESSDVAHRSQMSVMARFCDGMKVCTSFLGFINLDRGTAEHIAGALQTFMTAKNIDTNKMMFTAFDGCNTMSGVQKGVQRRLQHIQPFAVYLNCRNHRLALCLVHLIKRFPLLQDVDSALLSLWKLFEFSPQKMAVFKHIQRVYGNDPLTITRAATTRWLSHLQAAVRFVSRYTCILDTLDTLYQNKREPEVRGIRASITEKKTVATILLLCDILKPVNMLSLYLQEACVNFTDLPGHIRKTLDILSSLIEKYRQFEGNLANSNTEFAKCDQLFSEIDDRTDLQRRMRRGGEDLTPDIYLRETGIPLIYDLVQEIEDAFCTGDPVLTAFGFFNPMNIPDNLSELPEYGQESIRRLVEFYCTARRDVFEGHVTDVPAVMDPLVLENELKSVKTHLFLLRYDMDTRRKIREISDDLKRFSSSDPVADRVERRLRMIQSDLEADRLVSGRNEELNNLSMELRHALQQQQAHAQQAAIEERVRSSYLQNETQKHRLESDLDEMRRKLDMAEGSKSALQQQVDDMRNQLRRLETDRSRMKSHMEEARLEEELRERRRRRSMEEEQKKSLERELLELRQQMSRGATSETEELRRGLEKSERQRVQLSDHIETITKDLENREKQTAKLINELKSVSDKCEEAERHKNHLMVQVEDASAKLRDSSRELDKALTELRNTQLALADAEKKRDEFKGRAQETVRQWKMKVKQLERELDRHKHGSQQMMQRNEQLVKEMEGVRQQGHMYGIQLENMRRELGDALAVRAAQDEQIRLKDVEINELKSLRMDLDRELRDTRVVSERLENELHNAQSRVAQVSEDKNRLEDRLSSVEAAHCLAQDQAAQLQQELKDLSSSKGQAAAELSEAKGKIHDLRQSYLEIQHREKAAREESKLFQKQLQDERDNSRVAIETLKRELNEAKVREAHVLQDLQRKLKKDKAEYEAAIQALKMELSEDKSSLKISKRNEEKYRKEAEILQQGMNRLEEENNKLLCRLDHTKKEFEAQSQINESDMSRVKKLEDEIFHMNSDVKKAERKYDNLAQDMVSEVDALMDVMSTGCIEKFKTISAVKGALNGNLLADLKIKMKWLRNQLREKIKYEQKLRKDIRDALTANESDRKYLLQELARREEVLDELAAAKQELAQREIENLHCVEVLEKLGYFEAEESRNLEQNAKNEEKDHILDLTDELELRRVRESETHKNHEYEKQQIIHDIEGMRDKEKARIEERYIRLQDTMRALQEEIKVANLNHQQVVDLEKNIENMRRSPGRKKVNNNNRVRISTPSKSPHRRPQTPPSRLPKGHDDSMAPMEMSDEQFSRKFARRKSIEDGML